MICNPSCVESFVRFQAIHKFTPVVGIASDYENSFTLVPLEPLAFSEECLGASIGVRYSASAKQRNAQLDTPQALLN